MRRRHVLSIGLLATLCLATACSGTSDRTTAPTSVVEGGSTPDRPSPPPVWGTCDASKAQFAVGRRAGDELLERARVAAGASFARFLRPNQAITMEFSPSRLNLSLDGRDVVQGVYCG